mmetsp:Transcript_2193/g.6210  ORF Transcript_2193/g.6210 Transcript_2193/m.6210 type:complete len:427 (-) Transcript_2193:687-1967(-)
MCRSEPVSCSLTSAQISDLMEEIRDLREVRQEIRELRDAHDELAQECRARALAFEDKIFETRKFVDSKSQVLGERISELKSGIEAEGVARTKAISSSWSSEAEARARGLDEVRAAERANRGSIALLQGFKGVQENFMEKVDVLSGSVAQLQDNQIKLSGDVETGLANLWGESRRVRRESLKRSATCSLEQMSRRTSSTVTSSNELKAIRNDIATVVLDQNKASEKAEELAENLADQGKMLADNLEEQGRTLTARDRALSECLASKEECLRGVAQSISVLKASLPTEENEKKLADDLTAATSAWESSQRICLGGVESLESKMMEAFEVILCEQRGLGAVCAAHREAIGALEQALRATEANLRSTIAQGVDSDRRQDISVQESSLLDIERRLGCQIKELVNDSDAKGQELGNLKTSIDFLTHKLARSR